MTARTCRAAVMVMAAGIPLLAVSSVSRAGQAGQKRPVLALSWHDASESFPIPFGPVAKAVESVFDPVGIAVVWKPSAEAGRDLRVLLLPVEPALWKLPANALGVTRREASVRDTVYVFLPAVTRALGVNLSTKRLPTLREKLRIARGIGMVVSHEIFHALLFDQPHAEEGLMRDELHAGALDHPAARFSDESAEALRALFSDR